MWWLKGWRVGREFGLWPFPQKKKKEKEDQVGAEKRRKEKAASLFMSSLQKNKKKKIQKRRDIFIPNQDDNGLVLMHAPLPPSPSQTLPIFTTSSSSSSLQAGDQPWILRDGVVSGGLEVVMFRVVEVGEFQMTVRVNPSSDKLWEKGEPVFLVSESELDLGEGGINFVKEQEEEEEEDEWGSDSDDSKEEEEDMIPQPTIVGYYLGRGEDEWTHTVFL